MTTLDSAVQQFDVAMQHLAAGAARFTPAPRSLATLRAVRATAADAALARRRAALAEAHALWADDRAAGRAAFGRVAEEVIAEMREAVAAAGGLAARVDALLPTDEPEHIDDPAFPEERRVAALRRLDLLNRRFGSYARFLDALAPLIDGRPTTILDVASGHGGFAIALARLARARGLALRVIASDLRPEYVAVARARAAAEGAAVECRVADAFALDREFAPGEIDVITCTQSLHHFGPSLVAGFVAESLRIAGRGILFIDALRSLSRLLALGAVTACTLDGAFFHDATTSIRKSFVPEELAAIARCAPGGERVVARYLAPGFNVLRSPR